MSVVTLTITNPEAFSTAWASAPPAMQLFVGALARRCAKEMRDQAPHGVQHIHPLSARAPRRLKLAGSIRVLKFIRAGTQSWAFVGTTERHAKWVIEGTKPHQIDHRRAKALTIFKPSDPTADEHGFIFRRTVQHPGSRKNDFRERAIRSTSQFIGPIWRESFTKAIHQQIAKGNNREGGLKSSILSTVPSVSFGS